MSRVQSWDEQVKAAKSRAIDPEPVKAETPESVLLLRRIAAASERASRRLGVIEWIVIAWAVASLLGGVIAILNSLPR